MVELVQSAWGDWWIVHNDKPRAIHLCSESTADAYTEALKDATVLFPDEPPVTQPFRAARWAKAD